MKIKYAVPVIAIALALSACTPPKEAAKAPTSSTSSTTTPYTASTNDTTHPEDVETTEPDVSIPTTFKVGETAIMGDWNVSVTKVTKPTARQVKTWNMNPSRASREAKRGKPAKALLAAKIRMAIVAA